MSEAKHSLAPFTNDGQNLFSADGQYIGSIARSGCWRDGEQEANLALWTAAPDLLAAAQRALNFCLNSQSEVGIAAGSDDEMETTKMLRAALSKASPPGHNDPAHSVAAKDPA